MFPNDPTVISQFFGADRLLNNGDGFSESFTYNSTTSTGTPSVQYPTPNLSFDISLTGTIGNVTYGAGIPDLADFDAGGAAQSGFFTDLNQTSFDTNFSTTAVNPLSTMTMRYLGTAIGVFDLIAQVNTPAISLDGSTVNQAFILKFGFNQMWAAANAGTINNVFRNSNGSLIDIDSFTLQASGSAGPNGTIAGVATTGNGGATAGNEFVGVNVRDNGASFIRQVPEPTTLAILGLSLLGFAGSRRRKVK